jgi:hypothetical protein
MMQDAKIASLSDVFVGLIGSSRYCWDLVGLEGISVILMGISGSSRFLVVY